AVASSESLAVSALGVTVEFVTALVGGETRAEFDGTVPAPSGLDPQTANLFVQGHGQNTATSNTKLAAISIAGGAGAEADAEIQTGADVIAKAGSSASIDVSGGGSLDAELTNDGAGHFNYSNASILSGALGAVNAGIFFANSLIGGAVTAE